MYFKPLIFLFVISLFVACTKEVTDLPPATQSGANTFGCKVDGSFWVPSSFGIFPTAPTLEARMLPDYTLIINARNFSKSPTETEFEIVVKNVSAPGDYLLNTTVVYPSHYASFAYFVRRKFTPLNEWITTSLVTGKVTITKIVFGANAFASGTFEFDAASMTNSGPVIHVTEGRFDVRLP